MQNALTPISSLYPKPEIPLKAIGTYLAATHGSKQGGTNAFSSIKLDTTIFPHQIRGKHVEDTKHKKKKL